MKRIISNKSQLSEQILPRICLQVICLHINTDEEDNERILDFFGIKKDELPALRAVVLGKDLSKFKPETKDFSVVALKEFIGKFVDGKLKACLPHTFRALCFFI